MRKRILSITVCLAMLFGSVMMVNAETKTATINIFTSPQKKMFTYNGPDGYSIYWDGQSYGKATNGKIEAELSAAPKTTKGYAVDDNNNYFDLAVKNSKSGIMPVEGGAVTTATHDVEFEAVDKPACNLSVLDPVDIPDQTYMGSPVTIGKYIRISVLVGHVNFVYREGIDYKINYENNNSPGNAKAIITSNGGVCAGSLEIPFKIKEKPPVTYIEPEMKTDLSALTGKWLKERIYTGKQVKSNLTIYGDGGRVFKEGTDYTVKYKNNIKPGTATMTIIGKGKCEGKKVYYFKIKKIPSKQVLKVKKTKLIAKKDKYAAGYQFQLSKKSSMKSAKNYFTKGNVKKIKIGKRYARCRAYQTVNGKKVYGKWSKIKHR